MKLDPQQRETLVAALAAVDVVFYPFQCKAAPNRAGAALEQLRDRYPSYGVPFAIGGSGQNRQVGFKVLQTLVSMGLIRLHKANGLRRQVSLTHAGDCAGRRLCGLPTASDSFDLLLGPIADAYEHGSNHGFIHGSKVPATTEQLMPLLVHGWLVSHGDSIGNIGYALAPLAWIDEDEDKRDSVNVRFEIDEEPKGLPAKNAACAALYRDLLAAGLLSRERLLPEHPASDIFIPLSSGMWPCPGRESPA